MREAGAVAIACLAAITLAACGGAQSDAAQAKLDGSGQQARPGAGAKYRATVAQWKAQQAAKRPKVAKRVTNDRLREYVRQRLEGTVRLADGTVVAGPDADGSSASRPGVSHLSAARVKLSRLSETQTPQENSSSLPMTGISIRPLTK